MVVSVLAWSLPGASQKTTGFPSLPVLEMKQILMSRAKCELWLSTIVLLPSTNLFLCDALNVKTNKQKKNILAEVNLLVSVAC